MSCVPTESTIQKTCSKSVYKTLSYLRLTEHHRRGGGETVRTRGHGGHQENSVFLTQQTDTHRNSETMAAGTGPAQLQSQALREGSGHELPSLH